MSKKKAAAPEHVCYWLAFNARQLGVVHALLDAARTVVLMRCTGCGDLSSRVVPGHWSLDELRKHESQAVRP
jgi:hypothetical protein